jgi:hypothetical protein
MMAVQPAGSSTKIIQKKQTSLLTPTNLMLLKPRAKVAPTTYRLGRGAVLSCLMVKEIEEGVGY